MITADKNATDKNTKQSDPAVTEVDLHRVEATRKVAAAERHRKSDTDGRRRRDRQTVADNHLI